MPDTITKTFPLSLTSAAVTTTPVEFVQFRNMGFAADERVSIYLEALYCNLDMRSFAIQKWPEYDGSETDAEKVSLFYKAQNLSQKVGLQILGRKNNAGNWQEKTEVIITNVGRKQNLDLMPLYLSQNSVRLLEPNDSLAIKLIDYGNGLLKATDMIELEAVLRVEISYRPTGNKVRSALIPQTQNVAQAIVTIAPNAVRGNITIYNAGTTALFVREGTTVSPLNYNFPLAPGMLWDSESNGGYRYLGAVSMARQSGSGNAIISESTIT